jgi:hypothetical protein
MARYGPLTKDTSTVALGLAQIRVGVSATHIGKPNLALVAGDSVGALASTKFTSNIDLWKLESGFPLLEDYSIPIREKAMLECAFKEVTPMNMAYAYGVDASSGYTAVHSGEVKLGALVAPAYLRMEALYTYPNGTSTMFIIFPRAQIMSNIELDLKAEDAVAVPVTFEAKRADSGVSGGNVVWDDRPLGRIQWT